MARISSIDKEPIGKRTPHFPRRRLTMRDADRILEYAVERRFMRFLDWALPPYKKGKTLTRFVERDTVPIRKTSQE